MPNIVYVGREAENSWRRIAVGFWAAPADPTSCRLATADDEGVTMTETKISALFGALPTEAVATSDATLEGATFSVTPPGGDAIHVTLPPQTAYGVKDTLLSAAQGPVLFSGETESPGPVRNAIWWNYSTQEVIGAPAPTVADTVVKIHERRTGR